VLTGHTSAVSSAAFSPDGNRIVTASWDKTARVWDAASGQSLAVLTGYTDMVTSAAFSPDGTRIVTASKDSTARVWNAGPGEMEAGRRLGQNPLSGRARTKRGTRRRAEARNYLSAPHISIENRLDAQPPSKPNKPPDPPSPQGEQGLAGWIARVLRGQ